MDHTPEIEIVCPHDKYVLDAIRLLALPLRIIIVEEGYFFFLLGSIRIFLDLLQYLDFEFDFPKFHRVI